MDKIITLEKLKIYSSYNGDIDSWARIGRSGEKKIMSDNDWAVIDDLIQDLKLMNGASLSKEYSAKVNEKL